MASVEISSSDGQLGGGGGGAATSQTCYCFECDRTLTIMATSDSDLICPNCGDVVLEEFETPSFSSPPSPPPPPPALPPRSTTLIDLQSFFPTSDTDSDVELSEPLPPPPPPPFFFTIDSISSGGPTVLPESVNYLSNLRTQSPPLPPLLPRNNRDFLCPSDSEVRSLSPPSPSPPPRPPPSLSVVDRRPPSAQLPGPSVQTIEYLFHWPPQHSHFDSELDVLQPPPPPPPPPPPEHLLRSQPPLPPSSSEDDVSESFYSPSTEPEEDINNQHMTSLIQSLSPSPPPQPVPRLISWEYFFPMEGLQPPSPPPRLQPSPMEGLQPPPPPPWLRASPMEGLQPPPPPPWLRASPMEGLQPPSPSPRLQLSPMEGLQPAPPPPWLRASPMEGLQDMKMTESLVAEWDCHQCAICIDNFELNQMVKLMPCKHLYHSDCILRWLDLHKSCPVCRHEFHHVSDFQSL